MITPKRLKEIKETAYPDEAQGVIDELVGEIKYFELTVSLLKALLETAEDHFDRLIKLIHD